MSGRAYQHVNVEGIPFGGWIEPGDCYVSEAPLFDGDRDLLADLDVADSVIRQLIWGPRDEWTDKQIDAIRRATSTETTT